MTTVPCRSPRTEKRILEKQRRKEMGINGEIADKLHHADFNIHYDHGLTASHPGKAKKSSSPEKQSKSKDDCFAKRIEQVCGLYSEVSELNLWKMQGISHQAAVATPSPIHPRKDFKDKRKMPAEKSNRDPLTDRTDKLPSKSSSSSSSSSDLRNKLNKSRKSCPESRQQVTHKELKDRMKPGSDSSSLIEFTTRVMGSKVIKSESEDEQLARKRRQEHERRRQSDSSSRRGEDRRGEDRRRGSNERHNSRERRGSADRHTSGERRRSLEKKRPDQRDKVPSRKRPYHNGSGIDSDLESDASSATPLDSFKLACIFDLMRTAELSPLHYRQCKTFAKPSRAEPAADDDSEDDLDISKFVANLKNDGRLPSSPSFNHDADSDVDSDKEVEDFPLSKSVLDETIDRIDRNIVLDDAPLSTEDTSAVAAVVKTEPKVKAEVGCVAPVSFPLEFHPSSAPEKREMKPVVAVNPRVKDSLLSNNQEPNSVEELLAQIAEGSYNEDNMVDIRSLISQGAQFNLLLTFGFDKFSARNLYDPLLARSVKEHRKAHGDSESSTEDGKPEKPSCKVPCVPRAEIKQEKTGSVSPQRRTPPARLSPDQDYHRESLDYRYQPKRRRLTHDPDFEQFPPPYFQAGIPTVAIPSYAYLQLQPPRSGLMRNLLPPTRPAQCTFTSHSEEEEEKNKLDKALNTLLKFEKYNDKGRVLKKEADGYSGKNHTQKIRKYMEACIQYVYSALSRYQEKDAQAAYTFLHETANIVDMCLQPRARRGLDVRLQDKRLAVLCLILLSQIRRHMWISRRTEFQRLQSHCLHHFRSHEKRQKNEDTQNRSSQSTKSSDSPTPSPAGSILSMASYTGTDVSDNSPETVPSRMLKENSRYFKLAQHLHDWVEYWEEAGNIAQESLGFFKDLDSQCGVLKPTSHLYVVACYVGQGLANLDRDIS